MATYTWTLQGTSPTTIALTDIIQFAGQAFGNAIFVDEYQDTTHVKSSGGSNLSSGNTPHNTKYIDGTHVSLNGANPVLNTAITTGNSPLKINFAHGSSVAITNHVLYAYDGTTTTAAPTGVNFQVAEQGDASWTHAGGSAAALGVTDHSTSMSHNFFFLISASPTSVGAKTAFKIRDELIYS